MAQEKCAHLEVPDEVGFGVVARELVVEHLPVGFTLDALTTLAQDDRLLRLLRLLLNTCSDTWCQLIKLNDVTNWRHAD